MRRCESKVQAVGEGPYGTINHKEKEPWISTLFRLILVPSFAASLAMNLDCHHYEQYNITLSLVRFLEQ